MISAWGLVLLVTAGVVAAIVGIVSLVKKDKKTEVPVVGDMVAEEETALVNAFTHRRYRSSYHSKRRPFAVYPSANHRRRTNRAMRLRR